MQLTVFFSIIVLLILPFWPLQLLRGRGFREPFLVYIALLWFLIFFTGALNFGVELVWNAEIYRFRLSSGIYTVIFAALLLVYIAEGIYEARKVIIVSIGCQLLLVVFQVTLYETQGLFSTTGEAPLIKRLLEPRIFNIVVSSLNTVLALFLAVVLFQFLINRLSKIPLGLIMFVSLWAVMMIDSLLYIGLTRSATFAPALIAHALFKSAILLLLSFPMAFFIYRFRRDGELNRGSLDIFRKLENLERDLDRAHKELKEYAQNLEKMVEERTQEIRAKAEVTKRELALATEVQQAMLPGNDELGQIETAILYRPCHEVSGDLYDYARLPDGRIFFFIADISGHGVPSALVGAMCKMSLGSQDFSRTNSGEILKRLSEAMKKVTTSHYLTGTVLLIDTESRTIEYANGGHVPCLLQSRTSAFLPLEATGTIIGSYITAPYEFKRIGYKEGTRLVLFTDGITEQKNSAREEFGNERFQAALTELRAQKPGATVQEIFARVVAFSETDKFSDDVTLLIVDLL